MTPVSRREFNRLAAGSALVGSAVLAAPAFVRAQPKKLKVGVLLPRSGTQAFIGQSCQLGAANEDVVLRFALELPSRLGIEFPLDTCDACRSAWQRS